MIRIDANLQAKNAIATLNKNKKRAEKSAHFRSSSQNLADKFRVFLTANRHRQNCRLLTTTATRKTDFAFMQIGPSKNARIDDVRKTFAAGDLEAAVERSRNCYAIRRHFADSRGGQNERVELLAAIFEFFDETFDRLARKFFVGTLNRGDKIRKFPIENAHQIECHKIRADGAARVTAVWSCRQVCSRRKCASSSANP